MTNEIEIGVNEVLKELDPYGRALFDLALEKAQNRKLRTQNEALTQENASFRGRVDELERQQSEGA